MKRTMALLAAVTALSGCAITQTVTPASTAKGALVCIVENPPVRPGFLVAYQSELQAKGYQVKVVPLNNPTTDCELTSTYLARWSWDLAIYMSYAEIKVFRNDNLIGSALYDSRGGGGRMDKFIKGEDKIRELVGKLYP